MRMTRLPTVQTGATLGLPAPGQSKLGCCGYDELAYKPPTTQPLRISRRLRGADAPDRGPATPLPTINNIFAR